MELSHDTLLSIIEKGTCAPSGDNSQPWAFEIQGSTIRVLNLPEKDTSPFNDHQISNHIALGAAIENMRIAAESMGCALDIRLFPDAQNENAVADMSITTDSTKANALAPYIDERASNRRPYESKTIEAEKLEELTQQAAGGAARVVFATDDSARAKIAYALSAGEKIALENESIHAFLFNHVTWSEEDDARRHGFYIKTFEFKPPQEIAFKLFSTWKILKFFHAFNVPSLIAKDMEGVYKSSAAFGAIVMTNPSKEGFVETGMVLERIWLTATKLGLSIQPTSSVHLLALQVKEHRSTISEAHQKLVVERYAILEEAFGTKPGETITFAFRIGYAAPPSGRTTRHAPIVNNRSQ